jgi:hypothetical protein
MTQHCASAAAHWLQGASSISAPVMEVLLVSGFTKYDPNTGLEIDRMVEVRG